jgi:uncharacterized integral membrane protein
MESENCGIWYLRLHKMNIKNINYEMKTLLVGALLVVLLSTFANALLGVSHGGSEMNMYPGEERNSIFILDNYGEDSVNIAVEAIVEEGSNYLEIVGNTKFDVSADSSTNVPVKFSTPSGASVGDEISAKVLFRIVDVSSDAGTEGEGTTTVGFAISPRVNFKINIIEKPAEPEAPAGTVPQTSSSSAVWVWLLVAVVVLLLIIWIVMRKKKSGEASVGAGGGQEKKVGASVRKK